MLNITQTYEEVKDSIKEQKNCTLCRKTITKTISAYQTMNPWNKKIRKQIHEENRVRIEAEAQAWRDSPEICASCVKKQQPDLQFLEMSENEFKADFNEVKVGYDFALKVIRETEKALNDKYVNRALTLKDGRVGVVRGVYLNGSKSAQLSYIILRKDRKAMTQEEGYLNISLADTTCF